MGLPPVAVSHGRVDQLLQQVLVFRLTRDQLVIAHAQQRFGQQRQDRVGIDDGREHQAVGVVPSWA